MSCSSAALRQSSRSIVEPAALGKPFDEQEAAHAVALHRAVDLGARARAAPARQRRSSSVSTRRRRRSARSTSQSPCRPGAVGERLADALDLLLADRGKNGSASSRAEASSATGNWPSLKPNRSR